MSSQGGTRRTVLRYLLAIVATIVAIGPTLALPDVHSAPIFLFFLAAVVVTTWYGGWKPGLLATLLSILELDYFILPPLHSFRIDGMSNAIRLVNYTLAALLAVFALARLRSADRRAKRRYADLLQREQDARALAEENARALRERDELVRAVTEGTPDPVFIKDLNSRVLLANPATLEVVGKPAEQVIGKTDAEFYDDPAIGRAIMENDQRVISSGRAQAIEETVVNARGRRVFLSTKSPYRDANGQIVGLIGVARDITERKQAEEQLQRLNRTLNALNESNEALLHAADEAVLLQQVCRVITEGCGHAMVWIGFAEDDPEKTVRPVAHAGFEEGYLETLHITWADTERGRGPTGTAIRTGQVCRCRNMQTDPRFEPWRAEGIRRGYASSVSVPLLAEEKAFGAITIYSREPDAFSDDEVKLLVELAADLAYGLGALRLRAAHERTQETLRRSEEQLRVATLAAEIGVWSWVPGTGRVTVGANWRRLFGVAPEVDVTFATWRNALHPDDRERTIAGLTAANEQHRDFDTEYRVVAPDGTVRWIVDRGRAWYDEDGKAVGMAGINVDITRRKRAEEAFQQASQHQRLALEAADLGAWDYRLDTGEVFWDERCRNMFGVSSGDEIDYDDAISRIHPGDRIFVDMAVKRAVAGEDGGVFHQEFRVLWPDTSVHWISSHGRVYFEGEGEQRRAVRFIGVNSEITERKRSEQMLIQSEKLASVGRMAATIAHEINNPLSAVINAVYLVSLDQSLSANARQNLRLAEEELDRVTQITKTTLGFYRETSTPTSVPLGALVENVLALYRRKIREKSITVTTRYDTTGGMVSGIPGELRQVVSNLLANSLDAMAQGGTLLLRIRAFDHGPRPAVRLTVADNGSGISSDHLKRIFDPFFTTKETVGTGLGLWVSREIIRKCGGSIRVRSRRGKGTVFCIYLPATPTAADAAQARATA